MIILILTFLGLCFGSFVNALVWRMHEQARSKKKSQDPKLSMLKGRSMCPNCQHNLSLIDLVPVLSWVLLRDKCRYCKKPISLQYPLVELLCATLFVVSYLAWPYGFSAIGTAQFILWLAIIIGSVALFVYDLKWLVMPNKIVYPLIFMAVASTILQGLSVADLPGFFINLVLSLAVGSGIFYLLFRVSEGKWIGGGDVKFGLVYGFLLADPLKSILVIFGASILGTLAALPLLFSHKIKMKAKIPFGPFLITATIIIYLWGDRAINWYMNQFLVISV